MIQSQGAELDLCAAEPPGPRSETGVEACVATSSSSRKR
jgi:hypothetical protein